MTNVEMSLALPGQEAVLGLHAKEAKKPINNPFYEATQLEGAGKHKEAERIYLELLNQDFDNPVVMAALGMNYAVAQKNGLAHVLLQTALANTDKMLDSFKRLGITPRADSKGTIDDFLVIKRSEIQNALGTCYKHENKTTEARHFFELAQQGIKPNPDILNNIATLSINEGKPEKALEILDRAIAIDPTHAQAHWNRSLSLLEMGNYEEGFTEYDWGIKAQVRVDRSYGVDLPFWNGEKDARVIVYGEQGIGDEIMFASMLHELINMSDLVVFECHRKLHTLFAASFPAMDIYPTREDQTIAWPIKADGKPRYDFTHKIAIGSLGKFFRPNIDRFPGHAYLRPTYANGQRGQHFLDNLPKGRPNIGINWIGGHKRTRLEVRSTPLETLLPILGQQANFISLQYTDSAQEIAEFTAKHGIKIHQLSDAAQSPIYDDAAGLVANLDLVITVCSSVVHLAGSMGIPVWVMTPSRPAWRYRLDLDAMPWYSSSVLFRQAPGSVDWTPVIAEVADSLAILLTPPQ